MSKLEKAVVLAAGEGQRLRPFTSLKPKVLIKIANKPILQYVVEALATNGIRRIIMVVGYRKEQIQDYFGSGKDFGVDIEYVVQSQQLGTGHALKQAKGLVDDEFLVVAGDNIIDANAITSFIRQRPHSILIKELADVTKYGMVVLDKYEVKDLVEKPAHSGTNLANTGTYLLTRDIFDFLEEEFILTSALKDMIMGGRKIAAHQTEGAWADVVYPWDILRVNESVLQDISPTKAGTIERGATIKEPVSIGANTIIRSNSYIVGPVVIGESCDIGPNVYIAPSTTIGRNVIIEPFTEIKNSVIGNSVEIGSSASIEDSVIDRGCVIKGRFTARSENTMLEIDNEYHNVKIGAMVGEFCSISDGVTIYPGVSLGNKAKVNELKVIRNSTPDDALVA